jgi:organic radical activating enzyme
MILENYVCLTPFKNIEIHDSASFLCCPNWLPKNTSTDNKTIEEQWNSEEFRDIRKSLFDGSFKYCDKTTCPYLSGILNKNKGHRQGGIIEKKDFNKWVKNYDETTGIINTGPEIVQFAFDRSCNFSCPSCRLEVYIADSVKIKSVQATIEEIETTYSNDIKVIYITGSGDPFISVSFRKFLRDFHPNKYPKLEKIHLHTNASMWTEEMWNSMKNIHPYVKGCEISIDAATKETYENYTRIGGDWNKLINNLKFISTIPTLKFVRTSFVVQACNYHEMYDFVKLIKGIFGDKAVIYFGKIVNWGTFSDGEYKLRKIWDESHPDHENFKKELKKIGADAQIFHNMNDLFDFQKTII